MTDVDWIQQINPLIYRIQQQDKHALNMLYDTAGNKLLSIILRIVKNQAEAEDTLRTRPVAKPASPPQPIAQR